MRLSKYFLHKKKVFSILFYRFSHSFIIVLFYTSNTFGQISITSDGFQYIQDFNSLASTGTDISWVNGTTLPSWYATNASGYFTTYSAGDGSSGTYNIWSYGTDTDRALGSINQNASGDIAYGVWFENNSGVVINSIVLSLRAEQWRRVQTITKGYQRVKAGYKIANSIDLSYTGLLDNSFIEIPEAFMITLDTTSILASEAKDGNVLGNFATIQVHFPISLGIGQQLFLRLYDFNVGDIDAALAVDDLEVTFSGTFVNRIVALSDYNFSPYIDQGVIDDIPKDGTGYSYIIPTLTDLANWNVILQNFYTHAWNSINVDGYNYQVVEFLDQIHNKRYYVLRKNNLSSYFWGTVVLAQNPTNSILVIQAPHPKKDTYTGKQAAVVFELSGAHAFMVAGISRCTSASYTSCVGTTEVCGTLEQYRKSDVAHDSDTMFNLATTLFANNMPSSVFVQLHGFGKDPGDPDFIISCGTLNAMDKSVPDYAVQLREQLFNINSSWQSKIVHVDNYDILGGTNNVQGRYLNLYPLDDCTGATKPTLVTNRFLHVEQFMDIRKITTYYEPLANALNNIINDSPYKKYIGVPSVPFTYSQNFNSFATSALALTWGNNLSLPGWYAVNDNIGLFSNYIYSNGNDVTGGLYSFGNSATERSLGSMNVSPDNIAYGALFKNTTSDIINLITLEYDAKQWRTAINSSSTQKVTFSYQVAATINVTPQELLKNSNFTNYTSGDLITINNNSVDGALDGDTNVDQITASIPVTLLPNDEIFFRFYDSDETGGDRAMALDNFSATFSYDPILPINWVSFNIQIVKGHPLLKWTTASEVYCDRYEIMRSVNGHDFELIATQKCQKKMDINQYQFLDDQNISAPTLYYRINQFDVDNQFSSSKTLLFHPQLLDVNLWMDNNSLFMSTDNKTELLGIMVTDMMGRNIFTGKPTAINSNNFVLELGGIQSQVLVVKCIFNNVIQTTKIIVK